MYLVPFWVVERVVEGGCGFGFVGVCSIHISELA
jgi:hypothetical protein